MQTPFTLVGFRPPSLPLPRTDPPPAGQQSLFMAKASGLGLHDNIPDRPSSAKVAPVGCQLVTMALKIKIVTIPKYGVAQQKLSPHLGHQCIWNELHETAGLSGNLAVNRLGRCRATRPCTPNELQKVHETMRQNKKITGVKIDRATQPCTPKERGI